MLLASGRYNVKQVAEATGLSPGYINTLKGSPLFRERIKFYQAKMYDSLMEQAVGAIMEDANRNIEWLRQSREGEVTDDPASLSVRARCATALLERQVPKAERKSDVGGIKITIGADVKEKFGQAAAELEEYGTIEVEAEEIDG